jgi:hypothetical protein
MGTEACHSWDVHQGSQHLKGFRHRRNPVRRYHFVDTSQPGIQKTRQADCRLEVGRNQADSIPDAVFDLSDVEKRQ